jgi:hypothetical protein
MTGPRPSGDAAHLEITSNIQVALVGAWLGKARCDSGGNLYIRVGDAALSTNSQAPLMAPIQRITPSGKLAGVFDMTNASREMFVLDFVVSENANLYQAGWSNKDRAVYISEFSKDGSFKSNIKLEAELFNPYQISVFKSGEFLLSGTLGEHLQTAFTAVFDAKGKLIKKIHEPEDEEFRQKAEAGDRDFISDKTHNGNTSVSDGDAAAGSDGNVYLLRAVSPALIYVISPMGDVIRKLQVDSPARGLAPQELRSAPGKLAISFLEKNSDAGIIQVIDLEGRPLATYRSNQRGIYPGLPGCFDSHSFTFAYTDEAHNVYLNKAEPK